MVLKGISVFLLVFSLFLQGCSDINDGKAKGRPNETGFPDCDVAPDSFELLLEKPIRADIECAYDKISWLIQSVKEESEQNDNRRLSKEDLKLSIENREPEAVKVLEYLDLFFDLNRFILGSDEGLIIQKDFEALRDFLIVLNREFSKVFKYFSVEMRDQESLYNIHYNSTNQILSTVRYLALEARTENGDDISLRGLLSRHKGIKRKIDLSELFDLLQVDEESKSWLFLKRLVIGGNPNVITNDEFLDFLQKDIKDKNGKVIRVENKILKTFEVGYNLYRQLKLKFDSPQKRYFFQQANYNLAHELIYRECLENCEEGSEDQVYKEESLFSLMDVARWLNYFFKDSLSFSGKLVNLTNYKWELGRIKEVFIGNNSQDMTYKDIESLLDVLTEITDIGADFSRLFIKNQNIMLDKTVRIGRKTKIEKLEAEELQDKDNNELFTYILRTFRYFKGNKRMPIYGSEYHRDNKSIVLYGQMEFLLRKVARFYEKEYPCHVKKTYYVYNFETGKKEPKKFFHDYYCSYGHHPRKEDYKGNVDLGQLYFIILEFRQLFRDVGIIDKGDEDSAAENAQTIPDLFLYSANDDGIIQVSELLEFFFGVFSAVDIKNDVVDQLRADPMNAVSSNHFFSKIDCRIVDLKDGEPRYEAQCIRDNLYKFLLQTTRYGDKHFQYLPSLEEYYNNGLADKNRKALKRYALLLEGYTKGCPYDNMPYTESDIMAIYTGMYSIESTMSKFDRNGDNKLSSAETELAYSHFYYGLESVILDKVHSDLKAVKGLFKPGSAMTKATVRGAFKYLVNERKMPKGLLNIGKGAIFQKFPSIGREEIASILVILMDLTEPKRKTRYRKAGIEYIHPEVSCKADLPAGETKLIRSEWACVIDGNCP